MAGENELNALDVPGEVPPIEAEEAPAVEPEAEPVEAEPIDEAPDPEALRAEIKELQEQKEAAKAAAQKWRKEKAASRAEYFKSRQEPAQEPVTPIPEAPARPNQDDFDDYNDFVRADNDWAANRAVEQKKAEWDREAQEKEQNAEHQERMTRLGEKISEGFEKYPDFEDVALAPTVPITEMVQEVLSETENPADIAYYLGKNQTEAIRIARLTPIGAARAIAQIEAEITAPKTAETKKITQAPPPITPVGSSNTVSKNPEDMTQAEFEEFRRSQGAKPY